MDKALPITLNEFVDEVKYQQLSQDMLQIAKKLGATQAQVSLHASIGLNVTVRKQEVETLEFNRDKAVSITVYIGKRKGSASTTDIHERSLYAAVEAAVNLAKMTEEDPFSGLAENHQMAKEIVPLDLYHPWDLTVDEAVRSAKTCEKSGFAFDKKIVNSEGASLSSSQSYHVYANTHGFLGCYPTSRHSLSCTMIAQDAKSMERDYEYTVSRHVNGLEPADKIGKEAAQKAVKRLSARKIATQKTPVVFHSSIASGLIGQFIGAISGGRLFRKSSFLQDSMGKQVFPAHMHIYERPYLKGELSSASFDGDGVATWDKDFIKEGIVNNYVLGVYSARKLNLVTTGNSGGVHNLFVHPGEDDFEALLRKMNKGLLVTELMGPGINLVTGDYSRGATGFWVENGEVQFPVHEMTIAANMRDMFKNLVSVGMDVDNRGGIKTGSLLIEEMMLGGV